MLRTFDFSLAIANKIICQNLNIEILPGQIWGILGPNGVGKTTLLQTFAGLQTQYQGELFLNNKNLQALSLQERAQTLGMLFQEQTVSFAQTVFEYCLGSRYPHLSRFGYETDLDKEIVLQILTLMHLETQAKQRIDTLSGGELKRLNIACLLAQQPQLFLLDEPLNHLDIYYQVHTVALLQRLIRENASSVLMTLHDVNIAEQICHQLLLVFGNGDILIGPPQTVLTCENLEKLYKHKFQEITQPERKYWLTHF